MVDSYTITRRDAHVALDEGGTPLVEPATAVLAMLCEAMRALSDHHSADRVVIQHLTVALRAEAAVTLALEPDGGVQLVCCWPETASGLALADELMSRPPSTTEDEVGIDYLDGVGHVASLRIERGDPDDPLRPASGRLLAFLGSRPFGATEWLVLERAREALLAFWPHAARTVRAQQAQSWVRSTLDDSHMTHRELQVLTLLAEGLLATSIASRLQLSPRTVHKHLGNIYRKLGVHDRLVAVSLARLHGLVNTYPSSPASPVPE